MSTKRNRRRTKSPGHQAPCAFGLVPELVRLRDRDQISPAECAAWSHLVGSLQLTRKRRGGARKQEVFAIRRTRSGWRLFQVIDDTKGNVTSQQAKPQTHHSGRGLLILTDPAKNNIEVRLVAPPAAMIQTPNQRGTTSLENQLLYVLRCRVCGWSADTVRKVGRSQRRHRATCPTAEFDLAPYAPIRIQISQPISPASTRVGPVHRIGRRKKKAKLGGLVKGILIQSPLHLRRGSSLPDFYPEEN